MFEKRNRPTKDETLSTFSRNQWVEILTEDQFQHSLRDVTAPNVQSLVNVDRFPI